MKLDNCLKIFLNISLKVALRNEVQTLQQLVDQPPDVTAYKLMADSLRSELDLAHRQCCHTVELTEQKAWELEATYRQLQTHSGKDDCHI